MRIVGIVQARMASKRLPGKVLLKLGDKTILEILLERLRRSKMLGEIVVATSTSPEDDKIAEEAEKHGVRVFRGPEKDVLSRFYYASREFNADIIVRITADNPLTCVSLMDDMVKKLINGGYDYVAPKDIILGLGSEVVSFRALEHSWMKASRPYQREHVTPFIYEHPDIFKTKYVYPPVEFRRRDIRLTIDTREDYQLFIELQKRFRDLVNADVRDVVAFLDKHPEIRIINSHIRQKPYWESE